MTWGKTSQKQLLGIKIKDLDTFKNVQTRLLKTSVGVVIGSYITNLV